MATLKRLVENGTLFALAVAGIVVLTILAFSLQINEDTRFLLPLIPLIATLVAWSLSVLHNRTLSGVALIVFSVNVAVSHAYAHDLDPARLNVFNYLQKVSRNTDHKVLLTRMVSSTCQAGLGDRTNLIVVDYPTLNGNNAFFYSLKEGLDRAYHCIYSHIGFLVSDVQVALDRIEALNPPYIISAVPERQDAPNKFNRIARSATEYLQHDRRFELAQGSGDYLLIFRRAK
jgi:hypothetical protein